MPVKVDAAEHARAIVSICEQLALLLPGPCIVIVSLWLPPQLLNLLQFSWLPLLVLLVVRFSLPLWIGSCSFAVSLPAMCSRCWPPLCVHSASNAHACCR